MRTNTTTTYICEYCGNEFDDEYDCSMCEENHENCTKLYEKVRPYGRDRKLVEMDFSEEFPLFDEDIDFILVSTGKYSDLKNFCNECVNWYREEPIWGEGIRPDNFTGEPVLLAYDEDRETWKNVTYIIDKYVEYAKYFQIPFLKTLE